MEGNQFIIVIVSITNVFVLYALVFFILKIILIL